MYKPYRSKEQKQFANKIESHLVNGAAPLLLEGAAGLGKTRAYLTPLLATGKPIAICVPTRALAAQLLREGGDMDATNLSKQSVEFFKPRRDFDTLAEYKAHKLACHSADVLICTHQAALIDVLSDGALLGLKDRYALLFDEADQLPDAAALHSDCVIDPHTFGVLGIKCDPSDHRKTVNAVLRALPKHHEALDEPAAVKATCRGILDALENPVWFQNVGLTDEGALKLTHKLPARMLKRLLTHERLIFVSATLTINGIFDDFKRALGLENISPWSVSIEPAEHGYLFFVSEDWDHEAPDHLTKVANHITSLQGQGKVLVVVTKHDDAAMLGSMIPFSTARLGANETTVEAAARMELDGCNVLLAAGAWAGLDTEIAWKHVVMPKAPYGSPECLDGHDVSRYVDSKNIAVRRFRQGMARGLRRPDAVCTLHLLDKRFARADFVKALPKRFEKPYLKKCGVVEFRTRQGEFRKLILRQFGNRCAISGCAEPAVLDAAHLGFPGHWRYNHTKGILLRKDLHALMDAGLLRIVDEGLDRVVVVSDKSRHGHEFNGLRFQTPEILNQD